MPTPAPDPDVTLPPACGGSTVLLPLSQFGGYELLGEIARGGMGVVYRARQVSLNRPVALKMILAGQLASAADLQRFRAEAESAANLDHPNVLPIYEVGEHQGQPFFSMKLVEGGSLTGKVAVLVGDPHATAALVGLLARAVEHAHRHGVVHRDLKPSNVLIDTDGIPYVTDFGLAKRVGSDDGLTKTGAILGTPNYMAPEQARGEKAVGPAADVYALGAILYECLTGQPPFQGTTPLDTILEVIERAPDDPQAVAPASDPDLGLIALKCLEKDPNRRYESAAALADDLDRWRDGEPITARRPRWPQRVFGWARREPGLSCRLAMLAACALLIQIAYQVQPAVGLVYHGKVMGILAGWAAVSLACQWLLRRDWSPGRVGAAWLTADAAFLTGMLALDDAHESSLVLVYGLYVAASGVWLRTRLVWVSTLAAAVGYAVLIGAAATQGGIHRPPHYHLIVTIAIAATGAVVAYQVRRARQLSRFTGTRAG